MWKNGLKVPCQNPHERHISILNTGTSVICSIFLISKSQIIVVVQQILKNIQEENILFELCDVGGVKVSQYFLLHCMYYDDSSVFHISYFLFSIISYWKEHQVYGNTKICKWKLSSLHILVFFPSHPTITQGQSNKGYKINKNTQKINIYDNMPRLKGIMWMKKIDKEIIKLKNNRK